MRTPDRPRVFLGLMDIAGVYRSLELALHEAGVDAYFLNLGNELRPIERKESIPGRIYKYWIRQSGTPTGAGKLIPSIIRQSMLKLSILLLVGWIYCKFDVILLKSGNTLTTSGAEIAWLKRRGKVIVFSFHGSDSRPRYLNATDKPTGQIDVFCHDLAERHKQLVTKAQLADYIIDSPTSAHWQPKQCCLRQVIFTPAPQFAFPSSKKTESTGESRLRIVHCPSDPVLKGTEAIRAVVRRLQDEGRDIDYVELINVPNGRVIEELMNADLAIDQLYSDNYGGIFALEAMTAGTPVIVGGYAKEQLDRFVPKWARAPTSYTHPDGLYDMVRELVDNPVARKAQSVAVRRYISEVVAPIESARRFIQLVTGEAPAEWFFNPKDIRYTCGAAGPDRKAHQNIRAVIEAKGTAALFVDDKPELRDVLAETA